ncbi:MAG: hypothetical protein QXP42_03025 [Candidatus Micrarchaeia archaeon]
MGDQKENEELARLKNSGKLREFVERQKGAWNHEQWLSFLSELRGLGYTLHGDIIGLALEEEKAKYWSPEEVEKRKREESMPEPPPPPPIEKPEKPEEKPCFAEPLANEILISSTNVLMDESYDFDRMTAEERREYLMKVYNQKIGVPQVREKTHEDIARSIEREMNYIKFLYKRNGRTWE